MKKVLIGLAALVLLGAVGVVAYTRIADSNAPEELTFADATTTTGAGGATTPTAAFDGSFDGAWAPTGASQVGYRVEEVLFGRKVTAVGRTNAVTGAMQVQGTTVREASFTVDMTKVASDEGRRDNQFRGRIMQVSQFPTATFQLTEPLSVPSLPTDQQEVAATAKGKLTLHGTTKDVSFPVKARRDGGTIQVNGSIPVTFADYGIPDASFAGVADVEDRGAIELLLVFAKQA